MMASAGIDTTPIRSAIVTTDSMTRQAATDAPMATQPKSLAAIVMWGS
jgi:hypothetical protein